MLRHLYNALWCPALPIALYVAGGGSGADRRERLGATGPAAVGASARIWLHAASVGEIEGARRLALGLKQEIPNSILIVTTMTAAGREAARRRIPGADRYSLAPFDSPWVIRRFLRMTRPSIVLIAETELWPNYFIGARRFGARLAIVNGRISARSLARYRWVKPLFAEALNSADLILAQTDDDARRYRELGAPSDRIVVSGNLKYDLEEPVANLPLRPELEAFAAGKPILVAGSTAPGEEQIVLEAYSNLLARFPDLGLVLAPRHLNRVSAVENAVEAAGLGYANASTLHSAQGPLPRVLILDTMGELRALYRLAAIAFVGGSIAPGRGGQNLAEPAAASIPVLFGPFHESQEQMASALVAAGGARVVNDSVQLFDACAALLGDESRRAEAGRKARDAFERLAGSTAPALMRVKALASLS